MTRGEALKRARELLARHHIEDAALEAELLLRHTLKIDRAQLYTEPDCRAEAEASRYLQDVYQAAHQR